MRKADYRYAINLLQRAEKYGTKLYEHPLAVDGQSVQAAGRAVRRMWPFTRLPTHPFAKPRRAPLKRRLYTP